MTPFSRSFGSGPRSVLGIHCTLGHSGAWRGMAQAWGDAVTLHAFDLPDHGRSGAWDRTEDLHDLSTAWAHSQLSEPMDLVGHSFGATVALRLALEVPEKVRSLVMIEPVLMAFAVADAPELGVQYAAENTAVEAAMAEGDTMAAARAFNSNWGDGTPWDHIPEATRRYMADRIHFIEGSAPAVQHDRPNLMRRLEALACPVLLMEGSRANTMARAINDAVMRRLPTAQRSIIPEAGHMAPITHPQETAEEISAFWAAYK